MILFCVLSLISETDCKKPFPLKFIVGKDIAMLRVDVASARICNINDEVLKWNVMSGAKNNDDDERKNQNAS